MWNLGQYWNFKKWKFWVDSWRKKTCSWVYIVPTVKFFFLNLCRIYIFWFLTLGIDDLHAMNSSLSWFILAVVKCQKFCSIMILIYNARKGLFTTCQLLFILLRSIVIMIVLVWLVAQSMPKHASEDFMSYCVEMAPFVIYFDLTSLHSSRMGKILYNVG